MMVSPALRKSSAWSSGRWVLITRTLYKGQVEIYWLREQQLAGKWVKKYEENDVRLLSLKCMRSVERSDRAAASAARLAAKLLAEESFNHLQSIKSQFFCHRGRIIQVAFCLWEKTKSLCKKYIPLFPVLVEPRHCDNFCQIFHA